MIYQQLYVCYDKDMSIVTKHGTIVSVAQNGNAHHCCFTDRVPDAAVDIEYVQNMRICLFQSKLYQLNTIVDLGVLVVGGHRSVQYQLHGTAMPLPNNFLRAEVSLSGVQICTPMGVDILSNGAVHDAVGNVDEIIVSEVLEHPSGCKNGKPANVKYFGRSARLIFNSSAASESVL